MRSVDRVLTEIGIVEFTPVEIFQMAEKYKKALLDGLEGKSELPMYPSYLEPVDPQKLPGGKSALVIEIGGTNAYAGVATVTEKGVAITESYKAEFPRRIYESVADFFATLSDLLAPLLDHTAPDAIGIVYAHPASSIKKPLGNDAKIDSLSKEFVIPGITEAPLGELLRIHMGEKYAYLKNLPTVAMNDTVAVLLSRGALIGGVVATGMNFAVATPKGIANTESGDFKGVPETVAFKEVLEASDRPDHHHGEKHIGGLYLPEYFKIAIRTLREEGYNLALPSVIDAAVLGGFLEKETTSEPDKTFQLISRIIMNRSAVIVGAEVAGAVNAFQSQTSDVIQVPVEGSLFWGAPGYADAATRAASEASGKTVKFVNIPHAGRVGAGVSALGTLLQK